MTCITIDDGEGKNGKAGVTADARLKTSAVAFTLTEKNVVDGNAYNITTRKMSLTSDSESALLYVRNDEAKDLIIDSIFVAIKDYAGTVGQPELKILKNPKAGTVITDEIDAEITNRNYGITADLDGCFYKGGEGKTLSSTDNDFEVLLPSTAAVTFLSFDTLTVLPKGKSIGISYVPPTGMTSVTIVVGLNATLIGGE